MRKKSQANGVAFPQNFGGCVFCAAKRADGDFFVGVNLDFYVAVFTVCACKGCLFVLFRSEFYLNVKSDIAASIILYISTIVNRQSIFYHIRWQTNRKDFTSWLSMNRFIAPWKKRASPPIRWSTSTASAAVLLTVWNTISPSARKPWMICAAFWIVGWRIFWNIKKPPHSNECGGQPT